MIELLAVLTEGGVPVTVKTTTDSEGDVLVGALVEAAQALSMMVASGKIQRLGFKDKTMLVLESKKRYTVIAIVDRAEDYMNSLLQVIADDIDSSLIPRADGVVTDVHRQIVSQIIDSHIRDTIETSVHSIISDVWSPILNAIRSKRHLSAIEDDIRELFRRGEDEEKWTAFKNSVGVSKTLAFDYAMHGAFDYACAASMGLEAPVERIFCIKMGAFAASMTRTVVPPVRELRRLADGLDSKDPISKLAKHLVGLLDGTTIRADYFRAFRDAITQFEFIDDESHLMTGLIFVDPRIGEYPILANRLRALYEGKSIIITSYIDTILERRRILAKVYSVTDYDHFKEDMGIYRGRIPAVLDTINMVLRNKSAHSISDRHEFNVDLLSSSLVLQSYITLLTGMVESPVLNLAERRALLEETLRLYHNYFRRIMLSDTPLFGTTLDSVFQSLSVIHESYHRLLPVEAQSRNRRRILTFLGDMVKTLTDEWSKRRLRFSLPVITNALCPVLAEKSDITREELQLILVAMNLLDIETIDATQITHPDDYATELGNLVTSLTAIALRVLEGDVRSEVLRICIRTALEVHEWFVSHGIVCREDIVSATYHATMIVDNMADSELDDMVRRIVALNRVVVQNPLKHDYELAVTARPLIRLLARAWRKAGIQWYYDTAKNMLELATSAWKKYGLHEMAETLEDEFHAEVELRLIQQQQQQQKQQ